MKGFIETNGRARFLKSTTSKITAFGERVCVVMMMPLFFSFFFFFFFSGVSYTLSITAEAGEKKH